MGQRTALVTGASSGIGLATARLLAERGTRVWGGVRRTEDELTVRAAGARPVRLDVTDPATVAAAADGVLTATGGRLDLLVNNAGITVALPLEEVTDEDLERQLEVNVLGLHRVTRTFIPALREAGGRIVQISSTSGRLAAPLLGPYVASKFAVEGYSEALRMELRPLGVHVVVVEPGPVATPIWEKGKAAAPDPDDLLPHYRQRGRETLAAVEKRVAEAFPPEVVARTVFRAATARRPRARYLTAVAPAERLVTWLAPVLPGRVVDAIVDSELSGP